MQITVVTVLSAKNRVKKDILDSLLFRVDVDVEETQVYPVSSGPPDIVV